MKESLISTFKKALLTYLVILPFAIIGGMTVGIYMLEHSTPETLDTLLQQFGSRQAMITVSIVQSVTYSLFCWIAGFFIAERLGLVKPFRFEAAILKKVCPIILVLGLLFASDYFILGCLIPEVAIDYEKGISTAYFISALTYGGVIEEVLLRWFFMGLIALILVLLFAGKKEKKEIPDWIFIAANLLAALFFSAGHLPATHMFFGRLNALILFRCFLLNGGFALFFGRWYRKYGIQYAMLGHFGIHLIAKLILICFI